MNETLRDLLYITGVFFWALALYAVGLIAFGALIYFGSRLTGAY